MTLWPGQSQTVEETYDSSLLSGEDPVVSVGGYNVDTTTIAGRGTCAAPSGESFGLADGEVPSGNAFAGAGEHAGRDGRAARAGPGRPPGPGRHDGGRHGAGHARADARLPRIVRRVHAGRGEGLHRIDDADVLSTAGDAALSVSDPGHLMNGAFSLPSPLQVSFSKSSWTAPVSHDAVTIGFSQHIGANDALRTGSYSKTLTFTLSTTTP